MVGTGLRPARAGKVNAKGERGKMKERRWMELRHWFFDLDGTLARTGEDICSAWKGALASIGRDLTNFDRVFRIGPPLEKVVYELYDDATPELVAELLAKFRPLYDESGFPNTVPYPDVPALLDALKTSGACVYIVTNKRDAPTRRIAEKFGWNRLFDGIWSYDTFEERYRKDTLLAKILSDRGIAAGDAVMVGDTRGDVDAGKANGMATIGVTWGYGSRDELVDADRTFDSARELKEWRFR